MSSPAVTSAISLRDRWLAAITTADDEWLIGLLAARPDLLVAGPTDLATLTATALSPTHVRMTYESADRTTRQVLEALCTLPETTDLDTLAARLGAAPSSIGPVMDRLVSWGLVLAEGEELARNPGLSLAIPHPAGLGPTVRQALASQTVAVLADIALRIGAEAKGVKTTVIEAITSVLASPEKVAALVADGPAGTDEITTRMSREYLELNLGYGGYQAYQSDRTPEGWLLRRSLLTSTSWGSAAMPAEVAIALRGGRIFEKFVVASPQLATSRIDPERLEQKANETALALVADMAALLDAWGSDPAKLLRSGGLGIREVRRVAKLTGRTEVEAARLAELAAFAGLADSDGDAVMPTSRYDRWFELAAGARWAWLASAWCEMPLHLSLAGAIDMKDKPIPPLLDRSPEPDALARRVLVLSVLADIPAGHAVDRESLRDCVDWRAPGLWRGGPARLDTLVSWICEEAELVGVTAGGAASSFGRRLIAGNAEAAALAVLAPPVVTRVVLQADLTAVAAGEIAAGLRRELDLLADVESAGAATVYRFSERSLRRGFDAGRTGVEILAFLGDHASKGVPQPLSYLVEDLARRFGQVRVGTAGCYVRSADAAMLTEVVHARKTACLSLKLLAPTVAVSTADPATVERLLRDAGYLAATESVDGSLVLRHPPARRVGTHVGRPARRGDPAGIDDLEAELLPETLLPETLSDGPTDLVATVKRLRRSVTPPDVGAPTPNLPLPQASRLDSMFEFDVLDAGRPRPTHIARDSDSIYELLEQAWYADWLIRLTYVSSQGAESEFYAEITDLSRRIATVHRLPKGNAMQLRLYRIDWARVATEIEEEMQLR